MKIGSLAKKAVKLVQARQTVHGDLFESFEDLAGVWSTFLGLKIQPWQVAAMLALLKMIRLKYNPKLVDNILDIHGYAIIIEELRKKK